MITKKIKQSRVAKFLGYFILLGVIYAGTSFLLIMLYLKLFILFSTGVRWFIFLLTACIYIFLLRNQEIAKYKIIQRGTLYVVFFSFSAVAIFTILTPAINYIDFLRFRITGVNLRAIFAETTFYLAIACFITYTVFTTLMEIQKSKTKVLKQLIDWFLTTIIAGYSSLLVLFFYTGFDYQKKCVLKVGLASDYCYNIGESIYHWWQPIPALVVFLITIAFIILYFAKIHKTEKNFISSPNKV